MYPEDFKFTKTHEYVKVEGNRAYIGITNFAQDQLGDIVYVELPEVDSEIEVGDIFATVESVKAVSDCYSPVSGKVVEVNEKTVDEPEILNSDPHGEGWIIVIELSDPSQVDALMDKAAYEKHLAEDGGQG